jgi:hypothetical protein
VFPFNVTSKQVTDPQTGKPRTQYEYEEWEIEAHATAEQVAVTKLIVRRKAAAKKDFKLLTALAGKTDQQIQDYISVDVTDLQSAKAAIRLLARAIGMLARNIDIED